MPGSPRKPCCSFIAWDRKASRTSTRTTILGRASHRADFFGQSWTEEAKQGARVAFARQNFIDLARCSRHDGSEQCGLQQMKPAAEVAYVSDNPDPSSPPNCAPFPAIARAFGFRSTGCNDCNSR